MECKRLMARTVSVKNLNQQQIDKMYQIYSKYYAKSCLDNFKRDLKNKNDVILLLDKIEKDIKGFSTILKYKFNLEGKTIRGIFSGDTIIEKDYWGGFALHLAFTKYLMKEKFKNPIKPLYWFLISKGFKTYLMMANNFTQHYPRFEKRTPMHIKKIMDYYALNLYSNNYSTVSGTIQFDQIHDHLKQHISPITSELKEKYPRINYFAKVNPNWNIGHELVCIAEFPLLFPLKYGIKVVKKNTYYYLSFIKKYIESLKFNKKFKNLSKNKA